jgi:hypothetical protein
MLGVSFVTLHEIRHCAALAARASVTTAKGSPVQTAVTSALSLLAAPFGLQWVAAAYGLRAYLTMRCHLALFKHDTCIGAAAMFGATMPPLFGALAMTAVLWLATPLLHSAPGQGAALLAAAVLLGCAVSVADLAVRGRLHSVQSWHSAAALAGPRGKTREVVASMTLRPSY